jgi:Holliday junction resolvase-like predicted endonuclease
MKRSTTHLGATTELKACAWLLEQGFEVFRNVSYTGPVDIVVLDKQDGKLFKIDVKTVALNKQGVMIVNFPSEDQIRLGVRILAYSPITGEFRLMPLLTSRPIKASTGLRVAK